jgi:hypothetical protein
VVGEFAVLGEVNTQFLGYLSLAMNDLTNDHVLAMLAHNKTGPFFPKLIFLDLSANDVRQEGLNALLATGMHSLLTLDLEKNSNPQFINIMLTYPTRIAYLVAAGVETYGLQDDLNPRSTLNLEAIILKTKSFLREDFSNLAKLSFSTLKQGLFDIYNAYDCEVLADLLKINQWTKMPELHFKNDENGLNSSCLSSAFESQALGINLIDYYGTTYLHEFAERMLNTTQEIKYVSLVNTRFPPQFFNNLFKHSFSQLQVMILSTPPLSRNQLRWRHRHSRLLQKGLSQPALPAPGERGHQRCDGGGNQSLQNARTQGACARSEPAGSEGH